MAEKRSEGFAYRNRRFAEHFKTYEKEVQLMAMKFYSEGFLDGLAYAMHGDNKTKKERSR